jgi:hypothetical protein
MVFEMVLAVAALAGGAPAVLRNRRVLAILLPSSGS